MKSQSEDKGRFKEYRCSECGYLGMFEVQEFTMACPNCGHEINDDGSEVVKDD